MSNKLKMDLTFDDDLELTFDDDDLDLPEPTPMDNADADDADSEATPAGAADAAAAGGIGLVANKGGDDSINPDDLDMDEIPDAPDVQETVIDSPNFVIISEEENPRARWFVVHAYSGREQKVAETLKQRAETLGLEDKILTVMIPTQEKIQIKRGERKTVDEKIFPGYMLVEMELADDAWLAVRTTNGITGFIGTSDTPRPLPASEVEAIKQYMSQSAPSYKADFSIGEAVRIVDGPFDDFLGSVKSIDQGKGKVEVLVSIFGRETPVELDFLQVEKV